LNGVHALEVLNKYPEIELILTDINMPEMDGLTLLAKIKELNNPLLHSVIVSAYGDILNIRTAMNGGAYDFIIKPIDLNDLEITIKKALDNLETLKKALQARDKLIVVQNELQEARALQLSMLPKELPVISNIDFAVYMKTASEVSGDYYDFSFCSDGSLNVAIGDATGHGMRAGTMVSVMKALFMANSTNKDIGEFFNSSNKTIKQINFQRMMIGFTMLNINGNKARYINAGMPSLYLYKKNEEEIYEYRSQGMPLGAMYDSLYETQEFNIESGDTILLQSDAFAELMNENKEVFGYDRVKLEFAACAGRNAEAVIDHLKRKGSSWINDSDPEDDITFVVIKVK
jgi:sigma-B regulation protein RsbU (phosphoserine phosphatase)